MTVNYYCDNRKIATITVFEGKKGKLKVSVENFTNDLIDRPFHSNENPTYNDFKKFMERRCIAKSNDIVNGVVKNMGLEKYNTIEICKITQGRMLEDSYWLEIIE